MKHTNKKGFTLIEVLIVIAIIGILSSIVLVGLGTFRGRGRDARRISDLRQVQNALELYFSKNGVYPTAIGSWDNLRTALIGAGIGVNQVPADPSAPGRSYGYCSPDGTRYVLGANLEDIGNPSLKDQAGSNLGGICEPSAGGLAPAANCNDSDPATTSGYCISL